MSIFLDLPTKLDAAIDDTGYLAAIERNISSCSRLWNIVK